MASAAQAALHRDPDLTAETAAASEVDRFRPSGDYLLVEPVRQDDTTDAGLVVITEEPDRPVRGWVLCAGPDVPTDIQPGTQVVFGRFSGTTLELGGEEYLLLHAKTDLFGTLD